jgi:hypothetical protein
METISEVAQSPVAWVLLGVLVLVALFIAVGHNEDD